jgi:coenzyme PQQ precursor peptide PqqA
VTRAVAPIREDSCFCRSKENREAQLRNLAMRRSRRRRTLALEGGRYRLPSTSAANLRSKTMKWETPQASDLRYGFEITMYIATR